MKRIPIITVLIAALFAVSCSNKVPETVHSIPDHAFLVASMHPEQIYEKGQLASMESITSRIDNDFMKSIVDDPMKSGIDISQYVFVFVYFIDDNPVIGTTAVIKDEGKFRAMVDEVLDEGDIKIIEHKGYSMITPAGGEAAMAWNGEQVIFLASPDVEMSDTEWQEELVSLYSLEKEAAVTSIVDFNDFTGKMKDINVWATGDEIQKLMAKIVPDADMDFQFPVDLANNYSQTFMEFADGAMYVTAETHFSDDVTKAAETFMVAKDELNSDLLELAPGNDLLMAMAFSVELDKMVDMMKNFTPPEMDSVSGKVEQMTGVPGKEILESLNGDFVIAVNGAKEGASIPVEVLIGIGLEDESLQQKLMGTVDNMADVQQDGDFFMINANGVEIYSGIVNSVWVITNTPGYKDAVTGNGLDKTLNDSKFSDFANGSMGMYMNLDLTTYPAALQNMMSQGGAPPMMELFTETFSYLGAEASNKESQMTLKTSKDDENSLYSLLNLIEQAASSKEW